MNGRSIKLFLVDGSPTGLITAEIGQRTGKAIVAPRTQMDKLARRPEVVRTGLYVLVGPDPEVTGRDIIYIGEAECVLDRLKSHVKQKDFWTHVCIFTTADENLTKAHVKYLESRLVQIAREADRATLENGNVPPRPGLPESEIADMETFLTQMRILLPVLGLDFAQSLVHRAEVRPPSEDSPLFELTNAGTKAQAREIDDEFVVLKGSTARIEGVPSWDTYVGLRDQLVRDGVLVVSEDPAFYVFTRDYGFSSSSAAASVAMARTASGPRTWRRVGSGQSYGEWQEAKLKAAEADA